MVLQLQLKTCFIIVLSCFVFGVASSHLLFRHMSDDALVGFLCMYLNEHFQPKLNQMVYEKGCISNAPVEYFTHHSTQL